MICVAQPNRVLCTQCLLVVTSCGIFFLIYFQKFDKKFANMTPNGYLIFEDESFLDSTVAKMNALRKSGQFCDVRLQVWVIV